MVQCVLTIEIMLEERVSFIRRSCGMDRNNVLSLNIFNPISNIDHILKVIREAVKDKLKDQEKKYKKKKSKVQSPGSKLTSSGWNVRYDFKIGLICELRKDYEVAIK
jgi:hypothetical protein